MLNPHLNPPRVARQGHVARDERLGMLSAQRRFSGLQLREVQDLFELWKMRKTMEKLEKVGKNYGKRWKTMVNLFNNQSKLLDGMLVQENGLGLSVDFMA